MSNLTPTPNADEEIPAWDTSTPLLGGPPTAPLNRAPQSLLNKLTGVIARYATSVGAVLIGWIQVGTGAVLRTVSDVLRDEVRLKDFGAECDDSTDDTEALQRVINSLVGPLDAFEGDAAALVIKFPARSKIYIAGTVYLPSFIRLNLNGSRLRGSGTNTCFESGYWNGSSVVSNFGQANETKFSIGTQVHNGQMLNFDRGFRLFNFCENSFLDNIRFKGCNQAVYAKRCFYACFTRLHSRTPLNGAAYPAFHFDDAVNAITIRSCFAVGYTVGWKFSGVKQNPAMTLCGAETCTTGVLVSDATDNFQVRVCYFEGCTTALNFDSSGNHENAYVSGCWFNSVTKAITSSTLLSGEFSRNNKLNGAVVDLPTNFACRMEVYIPADTTANNTAAVLPAGYNLGDTVLVHYVKAIYDSASGLVRNKARIENGVVPFHYSGTVGVPKTGTIPFGIVTVATTTITVDMPNLNLTNYDHYVYALAIQDNGVGINLSGRVAMAAALPDSGFSSKTVTASSNGGFLRLVISGLTLGQSCTGIVRLA